MSITLERFEMSVSQSFSNELQAHQALDMRGQALLQVRGSDRPLGCHLS